MRKQQYAFTTFGLRMGYNASLATVLPSDLSARKFSLRFDAQFCRSHIVFPLVFLVACECLLPYYFARMTIQRSYHTQSFCRYRSRGDEIFVFSLV